MWLVLAEGGIAYSSVQAAPPTYLPWMGREGTIVAYWVLNA